VAAQGLERELDTIKMADMDDDVETTARSMQVTKHPKPLYTAPAHVVLPFFSHRTRVMQLFSMLEYDRDENRDKGLRDHLKEGFDTTQHTMKWVARFSILAMYIGGPRAVSERASERFQPPLPVGPHTVYVRGV
jgi:hypothetical protein